MAQTQSSPQTSTFSGYQKFVIAVLAFLQFTIILDFMILSPLGAILMPALNITTSQFGLVVSAYAFSAGASGLLAAGFADRFDRKKLLLFFYTGFVIGTLMCGLAPNYHALLIARIVTGIFGGVIGSISFAIVTDLFSFEKRGRVMGVIQTSFAASQILGLPLGLFLSNHWGWHMPFMLIVVVSALVGVVIFKYLKPIDTHLQYKTDKKPLHHLLHTLTTPRYVQGFASAALISIGGFMMMPFGSAFNVNNLGVSLDDLPLIYMISGVASIIIGPLMGRLSDKYGKVQIFAFGSVMAAFSALVYTRLGIVPLWVVVLISVIMYSGVSARMISSSALLSALPEPTDRGSYMAISSSIQQISGGVAAAIAGMIVIQNPNGSLGRFEIVGDVMVATTVITVITMTMISRVIQRKTVVTPIPVEQPLH